MFLDEFCFKVIELKTGATLGPNQEGEVCIRGPQTANGFLNLPKQSKEMFLDDGWVKTGMHKDPCEMV